MKFSNRLSFIAKLLEYSCLKLTKFCSGIIICMLATLMMPAVSLAQTVAACTADMYMGQSDGTGPMSFQRFDTSTNPFVFTTIGTAANQYNAMGLRSQDRNIYVISRRNGNNWIATLNPNGTMTVLGKAANLPDDEHFNNGEVSPSGFFYVKSNVSNELWRINPANNLNSFSVTMSRSLETADLAWHNGYLYSVTNTGQMVQIHPDTGVVTNIGTPQRPSAFGAMFGAPNGVWGSDNNGGFYKIDVNTGKQTLISNSPGAANNDGAKCASTSLSFAADLGITKSDLKDHYYPGEILTYTLTVRNSGPFGVANASVVDTLPATLTNATWTCGQGTGGGVCSAASGTGNINRTVDLPANATVTFKIKATVAANATGVIENTATVSSPPDAPDNNQANNTARDRNGTVTLSKVLTSEDGTRTGVVEDGETLVYTLTANNQTSVNATNFTMVDVLDPNVTLIDGDGGTLEGNTLSWTFNVPANETRTRTVTVRANLRDGATTVRNLVRASGATDPPCPSAACVTRPTEPRISMSKELISETGTVDDSPEPDEELTYRITLVNRGGPSTDTDVRDQLDNNVSYVSSTPTGTYDSAGHYVDWEVAVPGQTGGTPGRLTLDIVTRVDTNFPINGSVSNLVYDPNQAPPPCPPTGPQCLVIPTAANVIVSKQLTSESGNLSGVAEAGETLIYELTVHNQGGSATSYNLRDTPDSNLIFVSATGSPTQDANGLLWSNIPLPAGAQRSFEVTMQAPNPLPVGVTSFSNTAYDNSQPPPTTCTTPSCVTIPTKGDVTLTKTMTAENGTIAGQAEPGEELTYTLTMSNAGGQVSDYNLVDQLDDNVTLISYQEQSKATVTSDNITWRNLIIPSYAAGAPGLLTIDVVVRVNSPIDGVTSIGNLAHTEGSPPPSCPSGTCVITPTPANVSLVKRLTQESGAEPDIAEAGEQLTYTIILTNTGGTSLTGYSVL